MSSGTRALLTPGIVTLTVLMILSSAYLLIHPARKSEGHALWLFFRQHGLTYQPLISRWNAENPDMPIVAKVFDTVSYERRLMAGFLSGTPVGEFLEVPRDMVGRSFVGPLDSVGFLDLTDRLKAEGIVDRIPAASFSAWTNRGRIFGIPHDIHPVLLAYRADLVEAEGIDVSQIETWEDFIRVLRPMMRDFDGDGRPDRYLLNFWYTNPQMSEALLLQGGGRLFDENDRLTLASERNAEIVAHLASWVSGPQRIAMSAPEITAGGNALRLNGTVIASLMPDWLAGVWKNDLPSLAGKVKLMPLPAWEKGGRRTTVYGGTMLGISRRTKNPDRAWEFAKHLYLSEELAVATYRNSNIVTPVRDFWNHPIFHAPDPYFSGQRAGQLFLAQADSIPARSSTAFNIMAVRELGGVVHLLSQFAENRQRYDPAQLKEEALRLLTLAHARVQNQIDRNAFLKTDQ